MPGLFSPWVINGLTFRNRIGVSPMCQYSAEQGFATMWHLAHLGSRASGGAALVIAEATAVTAEGRISPGCLGLWSDAHASAFEPTARFIKSQGAVPGMQIAHAGRKASTYVPWVGKGALSPQEGAWQTCGPSALPFSPKDPTPKAMSLVDIGNAQAAFVAAAKRADAIGIEFLEVHAAHGYLLHSFYSPLSNQRQDQYGGTFANRIRFTCETVAKVRSVWPPGKVLSVRLSCSDWIDGGWTIEDSVALAKELKKEGVDIIDCSSGAITPDSMPAIGMAREPGYQVPFAEAIRKGAGIATAAVGLITEPSFADAVIQDGRADIILLARAFLRDPYWALHAAQVLRADLNNMVPKQYGRAF